MAATSINSSPAPRRRDLSGQTVVVIGGSSGIGLQTARLARAEGADMILTARDPDCPHRAGIELGASIAAFDATDFGRLARFFDAMPAPVDHLLLSGPGPYCAPLAGFGLDAARRDLDAHLLLPLLVATGVAGKIRPAIVGSVPPSSMHSISSMVMPARAARSATLRPSAQCWSYTALPKARASRMAIRSGSSACSGGRTQRVW
jgi:NAD(P)-dependent dehydrogenase (short-subunit alcohol dehydrogenase family)